MANSPASSIKNRKFPLAAELWTAWDGAWEEARAAAKALAGAVDFVVTADNPGGDPGFHPLTLAAGQAKDVAGIFPELNLRDRNRVALLAEVATAWACGLPAVLLSPGTHLGAGAMRQAKGVYDLEPLQGVALVRTFLPSGEGPELGVALSVVEDRPALTPLFFARAVKAGADFVVLRFPGPLAGLERHLAARDCPLPCLVAVAPSEEGAAVARKIRDGAAAGLGLYVQGSRDRQALASFLERVKAAS